MWGWGASVESTGEPPSNRERRAKRIAEAALVLLAALPAVIAMWPDQGPTGLPNGTTLEYFTAEVGSVDTGECSEWLDSESFCGFAEVELPGGGTEEIGITRDGASADLEPGDSVIVAKSTSADGEVVIYEYQAVERGTMMALIAAAVLLLVALAIGGKGLRAFASLIVSALFIWTFLVAGVHQGGNPLLYAGLTAVLVLTVVLHFTHGFSAKTLAAWTGTVCGVVSALLAGWLFSRLLRLTGIDETTSAAVFAGNDIDVRVLALAALLIALIGILNDITVAQASTVFSLMRFGGSAHGHGHGHDHGHGEPAPTPEAATAEAFAGGSDASGSDSPPLTRREAREQAEARDRAGDRRAGGSGGGDRLGGGALMRQALDVGRDHAASAIYTVAFSVVGAGLASFIVSRSYDMPIWALLQSETVASTVVQLLAGFVGLVVTMPATTLFAILFGRLLAPDERAGDAAAR